MPRKTTSPAAKPYSPVYRVSLVREARLPLHYGNGGSPEAVVQLLRPLFQGAARERAVVALFDTAMHLIGVSTISQGGLSIAIVEPRAVFELAILTNAASVILAHNHPSGNPEPSKEDVRVTKQIAEVGQLLSIPLRDHVIITETGHTSLAVRGLV